MAILNVENLEVSYGLIKAIKGISFHVEEGEIVALIGANGAGKTTTMHAIARLISSEAGKIEFAGTDITKYPAHKIVQLGMSQVPEGRRIFQELKVKENLTLGAFTRKDKTETAQSRIQAARSTLEYALRLTEQLDIIERIQALESTVKENER